MTRKLSTKNHNRKDIKNVKNYQQKEETSQEASKSEFNKNIVSKQITQPQDILANRLQTRGRFVRSPTVPFAATAPLPANNMLTYYPQQYAACANYNYTIIQDWSSVMTTMNIPNPIFTMPCQHIPLPLYPQQIISTPLCPYSNSIIPAPLISSVVPQILVDEMPIMNYSYEDMAQYSPEQIVPVTEVSNEYYAPKEDNFHPESTLYDTAVNSHLFSTDVESYLNLPKDIFPTARMLNLDPNPIIDQLCSVDLQHHMQWLLDLEFGVPKVAITRPIPIYNVKFNSIHCKNTPSAIHPGFESCSDEFKHILLFYYDCVVSAWYRGYTYLSSDRSVENFQSWLVMGMQMFGMCWP